ncbi:MAG: (2Fe-2S) ferredoxin domain-containing protein [Bacteroidetes bacterium]|nr:(2Fe-2S) ferredoxin domain-containing protein [Bacteroidota bacterium]
MAEETPPGNTPPENAQIEVLVCVNERMGETQRSCATSGSEELLEALKEAVADDPLLCTSVHVIASPCLGRCNMGPNVKVSDGDFWSGVDEDNIPAHEPGKW